jgi:hypothetical protein
LEPKSTILSSQFNNEGTNVKKAAFCLLALIVLALSVRFVTPTTPSIASTLLPDASIGSLPLPSHFWLTKRITAPSQSANMSDRSLVLDDNDNPHIVYGSNSVYYSWYDGIGWHREIVDDIYHSSGRHASLALDHEGVPHIAYVQDISGNNALRYATRQGNEWFHLSLDSAESIQYSAIAVDSQGYPHIAYSAHDESVRYVYQTAEGWVNGAIGEVDYVYALSFALDENDEAHIGYITAYGQLRYAVSAGDQWQIETITTIGPATLYQIGISVVIDSQGRPAIAYQSGQGLYFTTQTAGEWPTEEIDPDNKMLRLSLALDGADVPHIVYTKANQLGPYYATRPGDSWEITVVTNDNEDGQYPSIAIDGAGQPHVSYQMGADVFDGGSTLRYGSLVGEEWVVKTVEVGDFHGYPSLAVDGEDELHLLYRGQVPPAWYYVYQGQTGWVTETISMTAHFFNPVVSFQVDDEGNPHIGYYDASGGPDLRYTARINDEWINIVVAAGAGGPFPEWQDVSLAVDKEQRPHVAYIHGLAHEIQYGYLAGNSWVTETVAAVPGATGGRIVLALDSLGQPHIIFYGNGNSQLQYARLVNDEWLLETVDQDSYEPVMVLDSQDRPHIVYMGGGSLYYGYWNGSVWSTQLIEAYPSLYAYPSLVLDSNDQPHIALAEDVSTYTIVKYGSYDGEEWVWQQVDIGRRVGGHVALVLDSQDRPSILHADDHNGHIRLSQPADGLIYFPLVTKP